MFRNIPDFSLITQRVDSQYILAGNLPVIELHGNINTVRCSECHKIIDEWDDETSDVPRFKVCNGKLPPDVVWFGEALSYKEYEAAVEAVRSCDLFFSIGTSGEVQLAASLAYLAQNHGAPLIEINTECTLLTPMVDFFLKGKSVALLPLLVNAVWNNNQ
jgi:NAD-dependent deacetylase